MSTVLVWILVTSSTTYAGYAAQLGPFADLASCERVLAAVSSYRKQCVQVNLVLPKASHER